MRPHPRAARSVQFRRKSCGASCSGCWLNDRPVARSLQELRCRDYVGTLTHIPKATDFLVGCHEAGHRLTKSLANSTMAPNFGPRRALVACETPDSRLGPGRFRAPDSSAPQPPGVWIDRALVRVRFNPPIRLGPVFAGPIFSRERNCPQFSEATLAPSMPPGAS